MDIKDLTALPRRESESPEFLVFKDLYDFEGEFASLIESTVFRILENIRMKFFFWFSDAVVCNQVCTRGISRSSITFPVFATEVNV